MSGFYDHSKRTKGTCRGCMERWSIMNVNASSGVADCMDVFRAQSE